MDEKELVQWLKNLQDDPFYKVFDDYFQNASPNHQRAIEVASIPHWFNEKIYQALIDEDMRPDFASHFKLVAELPFCESYDARKGYNLKKALRLGIRTNLRFERPERFRELSKRASEAFSENNPTVRTEKAFHLLWVDHALAGEEILALEHQVSQNSGESLALVAAFQECELVDPAKYPIVFGWYCWIQASFRRRELSFSDRLRYAKKSEEYAVVGGSKLVEAAAAELIGNIIIEQDLPDSNLHATWYYDQSVRLIELALQEKPNSPEFTRRLKAVTKQLSTLRPSPSLMNQGAETQNNGGARDSSEAEESSISNNRTPLLPRKSIFLSSVSNEFRSHREQVRVALTGPDVWVETQESFLAFGEKTLVELDKCVRQCDAVVHLVGKQTGSTASLPNQDAILALYPNLPEKLGVSESFLRRLSYTQWEAWLAVIHGRPLYIAVAEPETTVHESSDDNSDSTTIVSQHEHLGELRKQGQHPAEQLGFANSDKLTIALLKNLEPLLKRDEAQKSGNTLNSRFKLVTNTELINNRHIERSREVNEILNVILSDQQQGALLVASAGFGKSCILSQVSEKLFEKRIPFLAIKLDSVPECNNANKLGRELELPDSPTTVLARMSLGKPSVLIVDQLDSISIVSGRKTNTWIAFEELRVAVQSVPGMKMVVACRDFDLEQDHRLRPLGTDDSKFKKVLIAKLTLEEIRDSLNRAKLEAFQPNDKQIEILSLPFHLVLFLQGYPEKAFSRIGDLYDNYWDRKEALLRQSIGEGSRWEETIDALTTYMSSHQSLIVPKAIVDGYRREIRAMVSANVLVENNYGYQFFHESFFDYAYARRFCTSGESLVSFLTNEGEEQHLFRRAQVRQILSYRRENDLKQYCKDLSEVLASESVRFHIRRMVASELRRVPNPRVEEWEIVKPFYEKGDLSRFVSSAIRNHIGWFDLLDKLSIFEQWLKSGNPELINDAIWFLASPDLLEKRSAKIAELIEPFSTEGGDWDKRLMRILSWGTAHHSPEMAEVYFTLVKRGVYDNDEHSEGNRDFWGNHHGAEKENPRFIIDLLRTWLENTVERYDDGKSWNFMDNASLNRSHTGSLLVGAVAEAEQTYFLEQILPVVIKTILATEVHDRDEVLNRAWPYLTNHGDPFDINDAVLIHLRRSFEKLAVNNPSALRDLIEPIKQHHHKTICYLLLSAYTQNPSEFADECVRYMLAHKPRLNIGYGSWSGGDRSGTGESAVSREAIAASTPHCNDALLLDLEDAIIGYCDEYEKSKPGRRGFAELLLLRKIDSSRRTNRANVRISELECSFPGVSDDTPPAHETSLITAVGSPIEQSKAKLMTDKQWVSAMSTYDGSTDRFYGGPIELSRLLSDFARKDRMRFANLALSMPEKLDPLYFSAILDGMTGRYGNLPKEEKALDDIEVDKLQTEVFLKVIRRLHSLPSRPCGTAIVHCVERLAKRQLDDEVLELVAFYATKDPDPKQDIWKDAEKNYYGGEPFSHGINSVRGQAAMTIASLLYADESRFAKLESTLQELVSDSVVSVRACAIYAITPVLNFASDEAIQMFLECTRSVPELWSTDTFTRFVHYSIGKHFGEIKDLLNAVLAGDNPKAVEAASQQIILADLSDIESDGVAERVRKGNDIMRKAAAFVYAKNINDAKVGDKAAKHLEPFFDDTNDEVLASTTNAFWRMDGVRMLQLESTISAFINSNAFENGAGDLLYALKNSSAELPHVVCQAADRVLEFVDEKGGDIQYAEASTANSISTLIVRQYAQTTDNELKTRCLDLIDRMERNGYMGIGDELAKIDR